MSYDSCHYHYLPSYPAFIYLAMTPLYFAFTRLAHLPTFLSFCLDLYDFIYLSFVQSYLLRFNSTFFGLFIQPLIIAFG